eukprot:1147721-Pelagomonas_calceolata.AAC.2
MGNQSNVDLADCHPHFFLQFEFAMRFKTKNSKSDADLIICLPYLTASISKPSCCYLCPSQHLYLEPTEGAAAAATAACVLRVLYPQLKALNIRHCVAFMELFLQHVSGCISSDSSQLQELNYQVSELSPAN